MTPSDLKVITLSNDITVATFRNVLLVHFRGGTPVSGVAAFSEGMKSLGPAQKSAVFFGVIEQASVPPDTEVRQAMTRFFEDHAERIACFVVTYHGGGFRAAMVRTIVSGVLSLMPRFRFSFPRHVVGSIEEAASLAHGATPALDSAALLQAFHALSEMKPAS